MSEDGSDEQWIADPRQPGPRQDEALTDLRSFLLRGLRYALADRRKVREDDLEDWAQGALLGVLDALDTFRGASALTTWAQKIAVRAALGEPRRRRRQDVSWEDVTQVPETGLIPQVLADPAAGPEQQAVRRLVLETLGQTIDNDLTERQRQAMLALLSGMPLTEVALRMGTTNPDLSAWTRSMPGLRRGSR